MEFIDGIIEIINNVGFPIAAFCMMWFQNNKMTESLNKNTEALIEMKSVVERINTNGNN